MTNQEQRALERIMRARLRETAGESEDQRIVKAGMAGLEWCRQHHLGMQRRVALYDPATGDTMEEKIGEEGLAYVLCLMAQGLYQDTYPTDQVVRAAVAAIAPVPGACA